MDRDLVKMLDVEYRQEDISADLASLVLDFLNTHESVLGEYVTDIKKLTKVASTLVKNDPDKFTVSMLERLLHFHLEGMHKVASDDIPLNPKSLLGIEAHLAGHMSDVAEVLYDRTNNLSWLEECYNLALKSAEMTKDVTPHYSAISFSVAARSASKMHDITGNVSWLENGYDAKISAANAVASTEPGFCSNFFLHASLFAEDIFDCLSDEQPELAFEWLCAAYGAAKDCARFSLKEEGLAARHFPRSARISRKIADFVKEPSQIEEWTRSHYDDCLDALEQVGPEPVIAPEFFDIFGSMSRMAAEACGQLYGLTHDFNYLTAGYKHRLSSAEVLRGSQPRFAAYSYFYAGKFAEKMAKVSRKRTWFKKAMLCYCEFRDIARCTSRIERGYLTYALNKIKSLREDARQIGPYCEHPKNHKPKKHKHIPESSSDSDDYMDEHLKIYDLL